MTMQPEELKALRTGAGLSQAGLGDAIGMARETIGAMERGAAPIELRTALAVRYVTEPRGDRTAENTAAALLGQSRFATMSDKAMIEWLSTMFVRLPQQRNDATPPLEWLEQQLGRQMATL